MQNQTLYFRPKRPSMIRWLQVVCVFTRESALKPYTTTIRPPFFPKTMASLRQTLAFFPCIAPATLIARTSSGLWCLWIRCVGASFNFEWLVGLFPSRLPWHSPVCKLRLTPPTHPPTVIVWILFSTLTSPLFIIIFNVLSHWREAVNLRATRVTCGAWPTIRI